MKVSGLMKFIGTEEGLSREGKRYFMIGLLQGMESIKIYVSEELCSLVAGYTPFCDVECELNIQIGQRTYINMDSIRQVNLDPGKISKTDSKKEVKS